MRCARPLVLGLLTLTLVGCGGAGGVVVTGAVTAKNGPLANAVVTFLPDGETPGQGGHGVTGPDGRYTLIGTRGEKGIAPGTYKVIVSLRLRPDGSLPDPNTPPIESDATERLLPTYCDRDATKLSATVSRDAGEHNFTVEEIAKR